MPKLNSKLISDIRTNKIPDNLLLSGEPNYGDLSTDLFWTHFNEAFRVNTTINLLALEKQNKDVIDNVCQILKQVNSKLTTLQLRQQDAASIEKLLSVLTDSKVDELVLDKLDAAASKALIPALTDLNSKIISLGLFRLDAACIQELLFPLKHPNNKIISLGLFQLDAASTQKLLPVLKHPNSKITSLTLIQLDAASIQKLLSALKDPDSKITSLGLRKLDAASIEILLPVLTDPNSKITSLGLMRLDAAGLRKLFSALKNLNSKITSLTLSQPDIASIENLVLDLKDSKINLLTLRRLDAASLKKLLPALDATSKISKIKLTGVSEEGLNLLYQHLQSSHHKLKIKGSFSQEWESKFQSLYTQSAPTSSGTSKNLLSAKRKMPPFPQEEAHHIHPKKIRDTSKTGLLESNVIETRAAKSPATKYAPGLYRLGVLGAIKTEKTPEKSNKKLIKWGLHPLP